MAGRTRFYLVAGVIGAILGQFLAAGVAAALTWLVPTARELARDAALAYSGGLMALGIGLGAWGGVVLMRRWFRFERERRGRASARARVRARGSRTPRPFYAATCNGGASMTQRAACGGGRRGVAGGA